MNDQQYNDHVSALAIATLTFDGINYPNQQNEERLEGLPVKATRRINVLDGLVIESNNVDVRFLRIDVLIDQTNYREGWPTGTRVRIVNRSCNKVRGLWNDRTTTFRKPLRFHQHLVRGFSTRRSR